MKKRSVLALVIVLFAITGLSPAFGQAGLPVPSSALFPSYLSLYSFGVFRNPLDAAFDVNDALPGPTFSTLEHDYFFGGLTNMDEFFAWDGGSIPLYAGYYSAGDTPWSALGMFYTDSNSSNRSNGITPVYATKTVDTDLVAWVTASTETKYAYLEDFETFFYGGGIMGLGGMNVGVFGYFDYLTNASGAAPNTFADANLTSIFIDYYDTAIAGVTPNPATNYTFTYTASAPDTELDLQIIVPLHMSLGGNGLTALAAVRFSREDDSSSLIESYTAPAAVGAGSFNDVALDVSTIDKSGSLFFDIQGTLTMDPLFGSHPDNRFEAGLDGGFGLDFAGDLVVTDKTMDYDYAGGGGALVETNNGFFNDTVTTSTQKGNAAFDLGLWGRHSLNFDPVPGIRFGLAPVAGIMAAYDPAVDTYTTGVTEIDRQDNDGDGVVDSAADRVVTTTTEYFGNGDGGDFSIGPMVMLPASLKIQPERWPFGVTLGTMMTFGFDVVISRDENTRTSQTETEVDGTGAPVSTTPISAAGTGYTTTSVTTDWTFEHDYRVTVNIPLPKEASIDFILNGNLLEFESFSIQAIIPLN